MITKKEAESFIYYAEKHKLATPCMLTNITRIIDQCEIFKQNFPGVDIFYAIKAFSDSEVVKALDGSVSGYDVASLSEIKSLLQLGVSPDRMAYSNPVKSEQSIKAAHSLGVNKFAFQSHNELFKIVKYAPNAEVYLRIAVDDRASKLSFSSKFGVDASLAPELFDRAIEMGLEPIGLTFHVGSQATDNSVWPKAMKVVNQTIKNLEAEGLRIKVLNLGGGFPVQYNSEEPTIQDYSKNVMTALSEIEVDKVCAEPGRFMVADSSVIITTIIGVEDRADKTWLYLDTGNFQSFIEVFEFGFFPYPVYSLDHITGKLKTSDTKEYVLTGPSCDSFDTMTLDIRLPKDLAVGNRLLITMAGAYTVVYGSTFNGFKIPKRYFVHL